MELCAQLEELWSPPGEVTGRLVVADSSYVRGHLISSIADYSESGHSEQAIVLMRDETGSVKGDFEEQAGPLPEEVASIMAAFLTAGYIHQLTPYSHYKTVMRGLGQLDPPVLSGALQKPLDRTVKHTINTMKRIEDYPLAQIIFTPDKSVQLSIDT